MPSLCKHLLKQKIKEINLFFYFLINKIKNKTAVATLQTAPPATKARQ
jgi:hypothetical protein